MTALTISDFRRERAQRPGSGGVEDLVRVFLPLVFGGAARLLPADGDSVARTVAAVFQTFTLRWRRLPKRLVIGSWLLRTTWFAAAHERRRLKLRSPAATTPEGVNHRLLKELCRWPSKRLDPVILGCVLHEPLAGVSRALRVKEARVAKVADRGLARLAKKLRRRGTIPDPLALLGAIASPVPPEIETGVLDQLRAWSCQRKKDVLVRETLGSWQWVALKRILRRIFAAFGAGVCVLVALGATFVWLAQHGYLTPWFIQHSNRQLAKEFPELLEPARPWPTPPAGTVPNAPKPPTQSSELYSLTNIWVSKLSFSAEGWRRISPSRVQPVNMNQGGRMVLRNPNARRSGLAGVLGIDFNWTEARLDFAGVRFDKVAVRYRGNGTYINSLYGPKQSFKVDLRKFDKSQRLAGIGTLNYVNAIPDNSYLHDALGERLFRDLGVPGPRTAFAYLTIEVQGGSGPQPLGLYVLMENLDADFAADRFGSKAVPVFKPVTTELFKDLGPDWKAYEGIYDLKTRATPAQLQRVIDFAHLVSSASDAEFARRLDEFLELEEFAAFLAGHVLLSSYDGFLANGQNLYLYLDPRSNKFGFIPWDQDHAWGEFGYVGTADKREKASIWQPSVYDDHFLKRVLKVDAFREVYRRQLERALANVFTVERLYRQIDELAVIIRPAVAAESGFRLKRFDLAVSTNWLSGPRDGTAEGPKAPVHQMKRFIANRVKSIRAQLDGKEQGVFLSGFGRH